GNANQNHNETSLRTCQNGYHQKDHKLQTLGSFCQCSGGWSWISSLWSAMECPVVSFEMGLCVWCDFGKPSVCVPCFE
ncbi:unnamed protein product, partial [Rangifer tarandus platyrhynchus]